MRSLGVGIAVLFAACVAVPSAAAAAEPPADLICPRAVPKLVEFHDAMATRDVTKVLSASRGAADAYLTCLSEAKTRTYEEPYMNYDRTRAAQFLVVEGRALAATGDPKAAIAALRDARSFADEVVGWRPMSQTYSQSSNVHVGNSANRNTDRSYSLYHDTAAEIRGAADEELAKLNAPVRPQASRPTPSPAPSP